MSAGNLRAARWKPTPKQNRLQILFEEKPDAATREELKSNGFRWSPKAEAWQRQLTDNAYRSADYIKAILPPFRGKTLGAFTGAYPAAKGSFTGGTRAGADLQGTHKPAQRQPGKPLLFAGIYPAGGRESADRGRAVYRYAGEVPRADGAAQRRELTQGEVKELYAKAQEAGQDKDTFSIYQLKRGDETRDLRFEPYDRLQAAGQAVDRANYELIYTAPLAPGHFP